MTKLFFRSAFYRRIAAWAAVLLGLMLVLPGYMTGGGFVSAESAAPAAAGTVKLLPAADGYVRGGAFKDVNYTTDVTESVYLRSKKFSDTDSDNNREIFIKYNLASVAGDVYSAKLYLYGQVADGTAAQADLTLYGVADDAKVERSTMTWNLKADLGSPIATARATRTVQWIPVDVTAYVNAEQKKDNQASIGIYGNDKQFRAASSAQPGFEPYLEIQAAPPAAVDTLKEIQVSSDSTKLGLGDQAHLSVKGVLADGKEADMSKAAVTYSSSNAVAAAVYGGVVTPAGAGKTTITATARLGASSASSTIDITVVNYEHVLQLKAKDDVYVRGGKYKDVNHDAESYLRVKKYSEADSDTNRQAFLKFDLSQVQGGIASARMYLYGSVADNPLTATDVTVYTVSDDTWSEKQLTWNTKPELGEPLTAFHVSVAGEKWYEVDLLPYIQEAFAADRTASVGLYDSERQFRIYSNNQKGFEPYLEVITYDPQATPILAKAELRSDKIDLGPGETATLSTTAWMTNGKEGDLSKATVVYESSNPSVASVSAQGTVTAVGLGSATVSVSVTMGDITMSTSVQLTVSPGVSLTAAADALVRSGDGSSANFGRLPELQVKRSDVSGDRSQSYMKFDLSGIQGYVTGAKLFLYGNVTDGNPGVMDLYAIGDDSWTEEGITWNSKPSIQDGDRFGYMTVDRTKKWREVDVTSYIQSRRFAGQTASIALGKESAGDMDVRFNSKDSGQFIPYLKVQTEPAAPLTLAMTADKAFADTNRNPSIKLKLQAVNAAGLKSFDFTVAYDSKLFAFEQADLSDAVGAYAAEADLRVTDLGGELRLSGGRLGEAAIGMSGTFDLMELTFRTKGTGGAGSFQIVKGAAAAGPAPRVVAANSDLTGGGVAVNDLAAIAKAFGKSGPATGSADINQDGTVNLADMDYEADVVLNPDFSAPVIRLDQTDTAVDSNKFILSGQVSEPAVVSVNGKQTAIAEDRTFRAELVLPDRVNRITVSAVDGEGNESVPVSLTVTVNGAMAVIKASGDVTGKSMKYVGYNQGHFMPGSNTAGWLEYAGVNAIRFWAAPSVYAPAADVDQGEDVADIAAFDAKKAQLRANPESSRFINWASIQDKLENLTYPGANKYKVNYVLQELNRLHIDAIAQLHSTAWGGAWSQNWQQWQSYYALAFHMAKNGNVQMFAFMNEPNHSNQNVTQAQYIQGLKISSDAVRSAVEDVNRLYGKSLKALMVAPVTAGSPEGPWGQITMKNIRTDYHEQQVDYDIFNIFSNQQYSQPDNFYANQVDQMKQMMQTSSPTHQVLPIIYTEFGRYTTATYETRPETLDTPYVLRDIASIYGTTMEHGVTGMMAFKFSNTVTSLYPNGYKSGHHYVWNEGNYDVGGAKRTAEVVRLFAKGFKNERDLFRTNVYSLDKEYKAYTSFDPATNNYYMWLPQPSDSENFKLTVDVSGLPGVEPGAVVTAEEVSERRYGEIVQQAVLDGEKRIAWIQPKSSVWLLTIPKGNINGSRAVTASEDAYVTAGTEENNGSADRLAVRLNAASDVPGSQVSYVKFRLNEADRTNAKRAFLQLYSNGTGTGADYSFHVYGLMNDGWSEQQLRYGSAPNLDAATGKISGTGSSAFVAGQLTVNAAGYYQIDITDALKKHPDTELTFVLIREERFRGDNADNGRQINFGSKESAIPEQRPQLVIWQ